MKSQHPKKVGDPRARPLKNVSLFPFMFVYCLIHFVPSAKKESESEEEEEEEDDDDEDGIDDKVVDSKSKSSVTVDATA